MIDEIASCLEDDETSKLTKRGYLEISSLDETGVIAEEGMQDAVSESDNGIQIKRTRTDGILRHIGFDMTDEIPNLSSSNGVGMKSPLDTCVELNSASQNSITLKHDLATTKEKENSIKTEADAAQTDLSNNKLGEKIEKHRDKSDRTADGPNLTSEEIVTENGQSNSIIEEKCSSGELANNLTKHVQAKRKKLLVLDINGLLADIISPIPKDYKSDINIARRASEQIFARALLSYQWCHLPHVLLIYLFTAVFRRPFCSEFLTFCFETFEVGIWSSRTQYAFILSY